MLEKKDVKYYKKLAYAQGGLGVGMLFFCFVAGVSAKFHIPSLMHLYVPYWMAILLIIQAVATMAASRMGKRWPLGFWIALFLPVMAGICAFVIVMPPYKVGFYRRYPCIVQTNIETQDTRCVCSFDEDEYLLINGPKTIAPCVRALTIINITSNINFLLAAVALIPELLMFVLVCNDLCCISCRRAALVPQVIIAGGQQPGQYVPIQAQTVMVRTDDQPGSSSGQRPPDQAGPLPTKSKDPGDVPHAF